MTVKNLAQFKRWVEVGKKLVVEYNVYHKNNEGIRTITKVQTNGIGTIKEDGKNSLIMYGKAKDMRFNSDNTVDFLAEVEIAKNSWLGKTLEEENKDYWLRLKLL